MSSLTANEVIKRLDVRYTKLQIVLKMEEDTVLPVNKVSALRGGMGEMMLRQNCISDRECEKCGFESECLVRRTIYSKYEIQPPFATGKDSIGYVLECENYDTEFPEGSELSFYLILFGKSIVYLNIFLMAFYALGQSGLGKERSHFTVDRIINEWMQPVLSGMNVYKENYRVSLLSDYIKYRMNDLKRTDECNIVFESATSIKSDGKPLRQFSCEPVLKALWRRIYMLDCFEGIETEKIEIEEDDIPMMLYQQAKAVGVRRYSSTSGKKMELEGIKGNMILRNVKEPILMLMIAGEIMHVGKYTSFGFGRLRVKRNEQPFDRFS